MISGATASYVHGASETALLGLTVGQCLDASAEQFPDREALVVIHQDVRWTYRELRDHAERCAAGLLALGLGRGDRVGIWAPNCAEWVVAQFATAKAGAILVTINPAYRTAELEHALTATQCAALLVAPRFKSSDYLSMLRELAPELARGRPGQLRIESLPDLRTVVLLAGDHEPGTMSFDRLLASQTDEYRGALLAREAELQFDDAINIQFTSGTTGTPKAAALTHHNIVNNAFFAGRRMMLEAGDRLCIPVPMYHCFGMVLGTLACVVHGATMVLPSAGFDALATLRAIEGERCTALHGVPTMFITMLEHPDFTNSDLSSLRTGIMAGAPCPETLMRRVIGEMHAQQITIAYGMTETGPVSIQTSVDDDLEHRVTTVGRVLPHTEIKIVDREHQIVPRGETGELLTRGYLVMRGYWNDPQTTAEAIDESRWISSGDLAILDSDGYCQIVGRSKDMLIRGGENIYPREIEEFLYRNPKVKQVEVFGVPDAKYGEEICAWIELHEGQEATEDEIRDFCRGKIAHFKIPRYFRFVTAFPLTVTGKVQKFVMREQMIDELRLDPQKKG